MTLVSTLKDVLVGGIDTSLAGNGGMECYNYIPVAQRWLETALILALTSIAIYYAWQSEAIQSFRKFWNSSLVLVQPEDIHTHKLQVAVVYACVFGMEISYKFSTKSFIFILNPCHLITTSQLYMLTTQPTHTHAVIYRAQLYALAGAICAVLFPVLNTRNFYGEQATYFIQHGFIAVIPAYLARTGYPYTIHGYSDVVWPTIFVGALTIYHFVVLQFVGMISEVNMGNIICPAVSDPFQYPFYRLIHTAMQWVILPVFAHLYYFTALNLDYYLGTTADENAHSNSGDRCAADLALIPPASAPVTHHPERGSTYQVEHTQRATSRPHSD